jgi:TorA maturation chaperone TorD
MRAAARELGPEDSDRARLFAVLAALFARAPDAATLAMLAPVDVVPGLPVPDAWNALCGAAAAGLEAICAEYDALFIGVGKPAVLLNASFYLTGFLHERPLAELRQALAGHGLTGAAGSEQTEDHIAVVCEAMRALIERDAAAQQGFFARHLDTWGDQAMAAICAQPAAQFYAHLARLAQAVFSLERDAARYASHA